MSEPNEAAELRATARRHFPWWSPARESMRNVISMSAFLISFVPIYSALSAGRQSFDGMLEAIVLSYLLSFPIYYFTYGLTVWLPLRKLDHADLRLVAALESGRNVPAWRSWSSSGGQWGSTVALLALLIVMYVAATPDLRTNPLILAAAALHLASGWWCMLMSYAVTYLRQHLNVGGAQFPGDDAPVFSDYTYLAQQIQTTFGASDVALTSTTFRRIVNLHNLLSFAFNTVIVSLMVSLLLVNASY